MKRYVLGFLFNEAKDSVVLIKKTKPEWQAGRLNGVGGKVEKKVLEDPQYGSMTRWETPEEAIEREFLEETGVYIPHGRWRLFATMKRPYTGAGPHPDNTEWEVYCLTAASPDIIRIRKMEKEEPEIVGVSALFDHKINMNTLSNIPWMVAMALNCSKFREAVIYY